MPNPLRHKALLPLSSRLRKAIVISVGVVFVLTGPGILGDEAIGQTDSVQTSESETPTKATKTKPKAKAKAKAKKNKKRKRRKSKKSAKKRVKKRKGKKKRKKSRKKAVVKPPVAPKKEVIEEKSSLPEPKKDSAGGTLELDLTETPKAPTSAPNQIPKPKASPTKESSRDKGFDFSGEQAVDLSSLGVLDFSTPADELHSKANVDINSEEYQAFVKALDLVASGQFEEAAIEFDRFQRESSFAPYVEESEYQLAKVLFKLGLYHGAFDGFRSILQKGLEHRRFQKTIEWLFFLSRKLPNNQQVLAQLARFRDVKFPDEYVDEHRYLVSKYIFTKAYQATLDAHEKAQAQASSLGEESTALDFDNPAEDSGGDILDFGATATSEPPVTGDEIDFGSPARESAVPKEAPVTPEDSERKWGRVLLDKIKETSSFHAKSRYLLGLYDVLSQTDQDAVNHFQEVVRLTNPRTVDEPDLAIRELALLSLARMHYTHQQFDRSIYYYEQIDRDSSLWLTSLFESSWAFFRRGDFEKALGNLLTLHSPFFEKHYFPESALIKSIIYYEACRYDEARGFTDNFLARYRPLMEQLETTATMSGDESWALLLLGHSQVTLPELASMVFEWVQRDPDLRAAQISLQSFQKEQDILVELEEAFNEVPLAQQLRVAYAKGKNEVMARVSSLAQKRLGEEGRALKELLAQSLRIQLEITRAERERIQRKMLGQSVAEVLAPTNLDVEVDDEHLYWPYEGEFWRDELGTYEVAFSMCREEEPSVSP